MNEDTWKGRWHEVKGKVKEQWGELTDDELTESEGKKEHLVGKIQQKYGGIKEEISRKLDELAA
jgi:uncharacterized protein YjbJ (UPF0337 family)